MQEPQYPAYEDTTRAPTPAEYENRTNPNEPRVDIGQGDTPQPQFIPELNEEARLHPNQQRGIVTDDDILRHAEQEERHGDWRGVPLDNVRAEVGPAQPRPPIQAATQQPTQDTVEVRGPGVYEVPPQTPGAGARQTPPREPNPAPGTTIGSPETESPSTGSH